ncbi:uncharacterized protein K452DRAFT_218581 [Aplosporella prunicola CBS 121167]|uniref:Zn(2)-C6 fungal-type domain-containing protein n=1 Tax=Aplosporella prunicola CBS 121167 TaxID=1176127 RepID=A0A6A6BU08_9PEZI|nr:uncharacterized protein K452DRAFT_218581 [Aplosporella prunicola CBS 121167]KAF2146863.1 hypothetical protein K452DRAFT_218581 [Aplosporella prunicola CBS 121167]
MQSFPFAPQPLAPRENQRNYVFVDEHNRHKRLKVMRACEGCRRRKIKCDAATTNAWPCAACIRLKLNCVPPTVSYDKDFAPGSHTFELDQRPQEYDPTQAVPGPVPDHYPRHHSIAGHPLSAEVGSVMGPPLQTTYADTARMYQTAPYMQQPPPSQEALHYGAMQPSPLQPAQPIYPTQPAPAMTPADPDPSWRNNLDTSQLTDALGELKIDHTAVAPYITNQKKTLANAPAVEDYEIHLPDDHSPDMTIRIPPEMMPTDQQALDYFEYFFTNIHPYCPVINRQFFFQQWQTSRHSISPLILEAVFACSSLMLDDPSQGNKWLALVSKHEESFKDVPRLSTIQAMILILKAREAVPKRGYFYRSWMTVVNCVAMAKDLDLDSHFELHQMGKSCGSSGHDCVTKTRVWHMLFMLEVMVGGPQGRVDFGVKEDTVDFSVPRPMSSHDEVENQISRQFSYFLRIVKNIQRTTMLHGSLRKRSKSWAIDPEFVRHNDGYAAWLRELPRDLQIVYPDDGTTPWIPSHYVANMHCYHHLGVIMHHRPQLHMLYEAYDPMWKQHMLLCYSAAKSMCRLQEAILQNFSLPGLLCMQRGISFTVYSVLTCTMLHLVAITSPDPELNTDARDYFVRHMRILEQCIPNWPLPEMQAQVNNLREAFSADLNKPFELKASFPLGSPAINTNPSPISEGGYRRNTGHDPSLEQPGQVNYTNHPISPPISASGTDPKADSPVVQSLVMMAAGQRQPQPSTTMQNQEPVQWNPTRLFDQWNTAFGTPPPTTTSQSSPPLRPPPSGTYELRTPQETQPPGYYHASSVSPHTHQVPSVPAQLPPPVSYAAPPGNYVTPSMWQDVVASSFGDGGLKRRWDYSSPGMIDQGQVAKRSR